ncbi:hypothetical protein Ddye_014875 [Dipteronia dyeriana]|uniref:SnoaL-like domain-containing protein n=1 Tax=Dipteronia dyeriana TaxID=168575 RepID=A0AAD9WXZ1_9ROSI|nr:hypothetical protein Ddye_014875 [Dipteronia dyeriana]
MVMSSVIYFPHYSSSTISLLGFSAVPLPYLNTHHHFQRRRLWTTPTKTQLRVSSLDNLKAVEVASPPPPKSLVPATDVVRNFYEGINRRDLAAVEDLIAEKCVYEDLIFSGPFVGRQAILDFFKKFIDSIIVDLQFVIDDISTEDSSAVGVTWHLEWKGRPFPLSKGCSFYRLEVVHGNRQIIYGRDSVEPAIKPGETALVSFSLFRHFQISAHPYKFVVRWI